MRRSLLVFLLLALTAVAVAQRGPRSQGPRPGPPGRGGTAPIISSICTTQGTTAGGDAVVITGAGFNNATAVNFGATSAGTGWWINSDTSITVSTPAASAGTVDVRVTNPIGQSSTVAGDQFTYVTPTSAPTITSITPNNGTLTSGDFASIIGTNLGTVTAVSFGGTSASFVLNGNNTTEVQVASPAHAAGTVNVTVTNPNGTSPVTCASQFTYSSSLLSVPTTPATATRPSYNTGTGFFTKGRGIYDGNGNLFVPVGANSTHYDAGAAERYATLESAEREQPFFGTTTWAVQSAYIDASVTNWTVPIIGVFYTDYSNGATATTGKTDLATLSGAVTLWVNNCCTGSGSVGAYATRYNSNSMFNIANEWGGDPTTATASNFRTGYVSAVQSMRTAGYTGPLVVDAGGGDPSMVLADAVAIEAADPLHSVVFSVHMYGGVYETSGTPVCGAPGCGQYLFPNLMAQLGNLTVPVILGEFGCANCEANAGSAPVTSDVIMQTSVTYQMGYIAWAWDDEASYGGPSCTGACLQLLGTDGMFNFCYKNMAGTIVSGSFGTDVVGFATYGILAASHTATTFTGSRPSPPACPF